MDMQTALKTHYDMIAKEYADVDQGTRFVLEKTEASEDASVLDVGCGTGNLTFRLAAKIPYGRIVGLDISEGVLQVARQRAGDLKLQNFEFIQTKGGDLPFADEEFDAVVSNMALHLFPDKRRAFAEVIRVMRPGGKAVLRFFGGGYSATAWMEMLGAAWTEVTEQPASSNFLYRSLWEDATSVDAIGEWLGSCGPMNFEVTWQKVVTRITEKDLPAAGKMRRLVGDFWKQNVSPDQAERIDELVEQKILREIASKGYIESAVHILLVTFTKP